MIESDKKRFAEALTIASEATGKAIDQSTMRVYWGLLKNLTIDAVEAAINDHLFDPDDGMFFPKPAHIVKRVTGTKKQQEKAVTDRAEMAWTEIQTAIRRIGSYGNLEMDDHVALAAVRSIGGWQKLCMTNLDKMEWMKKAFFEAYEAYERAPIEALPNNLPGRIELENQKKKGGQLKALVRAGEGILNIPDK